MTLSIRLKNIVASCAVVLLAAYIFAVSPYNQGRMEHVLGLPQRPFSGYDFMFWASIAYCLLLTGFFLAERAPSASKSLVFVRTAARYIRQPVASWRTGISRTERVAILATLLKSFYGPMMALSLVTFCSTGWLNATNLFAVDHEGIGYLALFNTFGYYFLMQAILFVDVLLFTVGYLVEMPRLGNQIRSVDPTLVGWGAALVCYPPFNLVTGRLLGNEVSDFPRFDDPTVHVALNLLLLLLMGIYASASVALGFKGSNLTHRGIVARGPYAVIRHPAYICKNMAWWIGSLPLVMAAFHASIFEGLRAAGSVAAWTAIYALRALTEEDHLRSIDGDYAAYAAKVRYRFIPGLI